MGIDFMSLLADDDADSAIDSDDEAPFEKRKRRFSQQMSCVGENWRPRVGTFIRQESRAFIEPNMMQSELSVAAETQQVEVYVSYLCPILFILTVLIILASITK